MRMSKGIATMIFGAALLSTSIAFTDPSLPVDGKVHPKANKQDSPSNRPSPGQKNRLEGYQMKTPPKVTVTDNLDGSKTYKIEGTKQDGTPFTHVVTVSQPTENSDGSKSYAIASTTSDGTPYSRNITVTQTSPNSYTVTGIINQSAGGLPAGTTYTQTVTYLGDSHTILSGSTISGSTSLGGSYNVTIGPTTTPGGYKIEGSFQPAGYPTPFPIERYIYIPTTVDPTHYLDPTMLQ